MIESSWPFAEKIIANTLILAEQLLAQLAQEAELLRSAPQAELIDQSAAEKKKLFTYLEELNGQLIQFLSAAGLPHNQEGVHHYLLQAEAAGFPAAATLANWKKLQQTCSECRDLNEQNGASIELLALHTKRSLDILKGKSQAASTYGPNGITQNESSTHTLTFYL